jgi:hypothetical protein
MASGGVRQRYFRCGKPLVADNTGRQCARCQRASRDKLIVPPEVLAEFWLNEQLREAFAAQYMGRVARAYRTRPYHYAIYGPSGIHKRTQQRTRELASALRPWRHLPTVADFLADVSSWLTSKWDGSAGR